MTKQYPVVYEWAGRNFSGYAPDIAGCIATAKTLPAMRSAAEGSARGASEVDWLTMAIRFPNRFGDSYGRHGT